MLTGLDDEKQALEAVCCGAEDYLLKGQVDGWAIARAIRYAMDRKRTAAALQAQEKELAAIYENAPLLMLLIDKGFRIHKVNKYATRFAGGSSEADLFRRHVGQALRCLYALEDLQGCGFGAHCGRCSLRNAVLETLATGRNHDQVETNLPCIIDGQARDLTFLLSAAARRPGTTPGSGDYSGYNSSQKCGGSPPGCRPAQGRIPGHSGS